MSEYATDGENPDTREEPVTFSWEGVRAGARRSIPLAVGVATYGLAFGVLARQSHLSPLEVVLMSGLVYAGSAQLVVLSLWSMPLAVITILLTTLLVNLRNLLMGITLSPWFSRISPLKAYLAIFFLADESWALTLSEFARGKRDAAFLVGCGLTMFVAWISSTLLGRLLGEGIANPASWGLDFAFTAIFLVLLLNLWQGKKDILPWIVAAIVAVVASRLLPGKWYILLGALAGSAVGVFYHAD